MAALLKAVLDIIFPPHCVLCKCPSPAPFCAECSEKIEYLAPPLCEYCGAPITVPGPLCRRCSTGSPSFDKVRSLCAYRGVMKKAILYFKFRRKRELADALASLLSELFEREFAQERIDMLIPVPLHKEREEFRGFNQAALLAGLLGKEKSIQVDDTIIKRVRQTETMNKLGRKRRAENIRGAFEVCSLSEIKGAHLLLLDDIVTTGTTLNESALTLKRAGASRVSAITLARTLEDKSPGK